MTEAELERLAMLAEECAEVVQIVGKIIRFGFDSRHPDGGPTNRSLLNSELADVLGVAEMLEVARDIKGVEYGDIQEAIERKRRYSKHQVPPKLKGIILDESI